MPSTVKGPRATCAGRTRVCHFSRVVVPRSGPSIVCPAKMTSSRSPVVLRLNPFTGYVEGNRGLRPCLRRRREGGRELLFARRPEEVRRYPQARAHEPRKRVVKAQSESLQHHLLCREAGKEPSHVSVQLARERSKSEQGTRTIEKRLESDRAWQSKKGPGNRRPSASWHGATMPRSRGRDIPVCS